MPDVEINKFCTVSNGSNHENGGHLKPVTLKPVSHIFRIFQLVVSVLSAFSACSLRGISSDPCFARVRRTFHIFCTQRPWQRAQRSKTFISLERMNKKKLPPHTEEPFSLEMFVLELIFSFALESFNPGPCFSAAREGLGLKQPFSIELSLRIENLISQ